MDEYRLGKYGQEDELIYHAGVKPVNCPVTCEMILHNEELPSAKTNSKKHWDELLQMNSNHQVKVYTETLLMRNKWVIFADMGLGEKGHTYTPILAFLRSLQLQKLLLVEELCLGSTVIRSYATFHQKHVDMLHFMHMDKKFNLKTHREHHNVSNIKYIPLVNEIQGSNSTFKNFLPSFFPMTVWVNTYH